MKDQERVDGDVFRLCRRMCRRLCRGICPATDLLWSIAHGIRTGILPKLLRENEMVHKNLRAGSARRACVDRGKEGGECKLAALRYP